MAKTKISEFSSTPANNTDIDSINIAEGCAPSNINDAIRELMAQLKDFQTGAVGDSFNGPIGSSTASTGAFTNITASGTLGVTGVATLGAGAILNTPASVTLTNATGLPISTGVSGLGTGVATALAVNVGSAGAPVVNGGALGTPSSGTATNLTGLPLSTGVTGTLPTTNGGTGLTSFTANGVLYASSTSALTSGSALTFDGTKFTQTASTTAAGGLAEFKNSSTASQTGNIIASNDSGTAVSMRVFGSAAGTYGMLTAGSPMLYTTASNLNLVADNASGVIKFGLSGAVESMRLTSTGLGIGTATPSNYSSSAYNLVIAGTGQRGITIASTDSNQSNLFFADADSGTGEYAGYLAYIHSSDSLAFGANASEQMRLTSTGLGIGTSSPSAKLNVSVVRSAAITNAAILETSGTGVVGDSNRLIIKNVNTAGGANYGVGIGGILEASASNAASLGFYYGATGATVEGMRITSAGNLGIGTSSPSAKLDVNSGATTTAAWMASTATTAYSPTTSASVSNARLQLFGGNATGAYTAIRFSQTGSFEALFGAVQNSAGTADFIWQGYNGSAYAERMRLDSAGNLGLGVTPSAWSSSYKAFQLTGGAVQSYLTGYISVGQNNYDSGTGAWKYVNTGFATRYQQGDGTHQWFNAASGTAGNAISFTQAMTLDASGNLGVGSTSPSGARCVITTVGADATSEIALSLNHGDGSLSSNQEIRLNFGQGSGASIGLAQIAASYTGGQFDGDLRFRTNSGGTISERARITSSGYFKASNTGTYDGSTGAYHEFYQTADNSGLFIRAVNANLTVGGILGVTADRNTTNNTFYAISYYNNGAAAYKFRVADSGNVTNTNNSYGAISDIKLKENIVDASPKLDALMQVKVRNYNMIGDTTKQLGVVAQELESVFPAMVDESPDRDAEGNDLGTTTKSVKYSVFVPILIKALQELKAEFDAYKASHP